jgi:hypothetical protein
MKVMTVFVMALAPIVALSLKHQCQCPCPCKPEGTKLKNMIDCFATWGENVSMEGWNSYTEGCALNDIIHCRLANPDADVFCKFDGTNNLVETDEKPTCYYNCGMQTCDAFLIAHAPHEIDCIAHVFNG